MNVPAQPEKPGVYVVTEDGETAELFEKSRVFFAVLASANEVVIQKDKTGIGEDAVSAVIPSGRTLYAFCGACGCGEGTGTAEKRGGPPGRRVKAGSTEC